MRLRRLPARTVFLTALLVAACGSDDDKKSAGGPTADAGDAGSDAGTDSGGGAGGTDGGGRPDGAAEAGAGPAPLVDDPRVPVKEQIPLASLTGPVDVIRDKHGMVHIYARKLEDAFFVQGYMMAVDRSAQLELARRLATGRLAELFGALDPARINNDITMRTIGLHRAARDIYAAMTPGSLVKRVVDSFASGVSRYNEKLRSGEVPVGADFVGSAPEHFTEWTPADSIAMGRAQSWNLSYSADSEIELTKRWGEVVAMFHDGASDPDVAKRAGLLRDLFRFAPIDPAVVRDGYPDESVLSGAAAPSGVLGGPPGGSSPVTRGARAVSSAQGFVDGVVRTKAAFGFDQDSGSNNWAVAASRSEPGHAMMASDPHLSFNSPNLFWPCHIVVQDPDAPEDDFEVSGLAFAGIPGVILGNNRHVAWGATTTSYDVTDVFRETVTADGSGVVAAGQTVPFERVRETIGLGDGTTYSWDVLVVPNHGPVVPAINASRQVDPPTAASGALSVRWTGHAVSTEFEAVLGLSRAKNVDEAREALTRFGVGGQNWMLADSSGNVAWTSHVNIPHRDKRSYTFDPATYQGTLPCMVLDGASGEHEWTGTFLDQRYIPKAKNPASGFLATANGDNIGTTLDNDPTNELLPNGDPFYLGCSFASGFRIGRVQRELTRLTGGTGKVTADEMSALQNDHHSNLAERLAPLLVAALQRAEAERATPGTHPELASVVADARYAAADLPDLIGVLQRWETAAGYEAAAGVSLDDNKPLSDVVAADASRATYLFNAWLVRAMARALEDEARLIGRQHFGSAETLKGFFRMMEEAPATLATYDATTGESALWDDVSTKGTVERRDQVIVLAALDAVDAAVAAFGADRAGWRWGLAHTVRFAALSPLWPMTLPATDHPVFSAGWPRPGDFENVDACNYSTMKALADAPTFNYGSGPQQRFVAEMTPTGPILRTALPGGAVADTKSPHFSDEAELWRRNQTHAIPFELEDVIQAYVPADERLRFVP